MGVLARLGAFALCGLVLAVPVQSAASAEAGPCTGRHWVATWTASPSHASAVKATPARQTLRMIVTPHLGGRALRLRFTNRYRGEPLAIDSVSVGRQASGAAIAPGTLRAVRFGGARSVEVAPGADAYSDRVELDVEPFERLAVSVFLRRSVPSPTEHFITRQTSFASPAGSGDLTHDTGGLGFAPTRTAWSNGWLFLAGVDVMAPRSVGAVVAFGDSLTDGFQGEQSAAVESFEGVDRDARYPDFLQRRLDARARRVAVVNAGISANALLGDSPEDAVIPGGRSGRGRLERDVLDVAGVTDAVVLLGINDLAGGVEAERVIAGLKKVAARARARGLRVTLGTIPPSGGAYGFGGYGDPAVDAQRERVNDWIREQGRARVADFDAALRNPFDWMRLNPMFDSSDHVHPSTAGYRAMAAAVGLRGLGRPACASL